VLDSKIAQPDRKQFTAIRNTQEWRNPFIVLNSDGTLSITAQGTYRSKVDAKELEDLLSKLPVTAWPFGRVISIQPSSMRSPDQERFAEEDRLIKRAWSIVRDVVRDLKVEMNVWPSA